MKRQADTVLEVEDVKKVCTEDGHIQSVYTEDGHIQSVYTEDAHIQEEMVVIQEGAVVSQVQEVGIIDDTIPHQVIQGTVEGHTIITDGTLQGGVTLDGDGVTHVQIEHADEGAVIDATGATVLEAVDGTVEESGEPLVIEQAVEGADMIMGEDGQPYENLIIQHMDIGEPLTKLRSLLEDRLQCSLQDHEFYLQDSIKLDPTKNLTSQVVQGSGLVQINVEVKSHPDIRPRLNIVDILKPAEEVIETQEPEPAPAPLPEPPTTKVVIPFPEESENVTRWIVDQGFRKEQDRLKIPQDPAQWNEAHVRHWIQWAVKQFSLQGVDIDHFNLTGAQLCSLSHQQFTKYIPQDKGDIFWTHLELLRKCKFVAVIQQPTPHAITTITVSTTSDLSGKVIEEAARGKGYRIHTKPKTIMFTSERTSPGNRTGNNGQIQLWQFLLELLTDQDCLEIIQWVGDEGEFKLNNPEMVAQLWGQRKNKPTMNYEKLSRALRYYYDGDMIAKVHGKRFVYKFVCNLKALLGYNAGELNRLVTECAEKKLSRVVRPTILTKKEIEMHI